MNGGGTGPSGYATLNLMEERDVFGDLGAYFLRRRYAWLFALAREEAGPCLISFAGILDRRGQLCELVGKLDASDPLSTHLQDDPRALMLFHDWRVPAGSDGAGPVRSRVISLAVHAEAWLERSFPDEFGREPPYFMVRGRITRMQAILSHER